MAYIVIGGVVANIQVLKIASLGSGSYELVQGTIIFCSLFWAFDMIVEFYGKSRAFKTLKISFFSFFWMIAWMFLTIKTTPSVKSFHVQTALETLFLPTPRLLTASISAYFVSQCVDIILFERLRIWTNGRFLWLRGVMSTVFANFVDHFIFSWLAWRVLPAIPVESDVFWRCYVFSSFSLRLLLTLGSPAVLYLGYMLKNLSKRSGFKAHA